jgi:hypothetical protein
MAHWHLARPVRLAPIPRDAVFAVRGDFSAAAAHAVLARGRSHDTITGTEHGQCCRCWHQAARTYAAPDILPRLQVVAPAATCGHPGPGLGHDLPGVCTVAVWQERPRWRDVVQAMRRSMYAGMGMVTLFVGRPVPDAGEAYEGGPLVAPVACLWTLPEAVVDRLARVCAQKTIRVAR